MTDNPLVDNKYSKMIILETLYNLAEKKLENRFRDFYKHAISVNNSMRIMIEYHTYKNAIDSLSSAVFSEDPKKSEKLLRKAKNSINTYRGIESYINEELRLQNK